MRAYWVMAFALVIAWLSAGAAAAESIVMTVPMRDVASGQSESGAYYIARFDVPETLATKRLDCVLLEYLVDASAVTEGVAGAVAIVEVFPLTEQYSNNGPKYTKAKSAIRGVNVGTNRRIVADITDFVRGWISEPSTNHGLVIGTLNGPKVANVSLRADGTGPSGKALQVTFLYGDRSGERVTEQQ